MLNNQHDFLSPYLILFEIPQDFVENVTLVSRQLFLLYTSMWWTDR